MGFLDRVRATINPVTIALAVVVAGGIYAGVKFIPPYYQAQKVDTELSAVKFEASKIQLFTDDPRAEQLLYRLRQNLVGIGLDDRYLNVYFSEDYSSVHADYYVFVKHPFGKTTRLEFRRKVDIPRERRY